MIIDDPDYHEMLDSLKTITKDDHLYVDIDSLVMVNESTIQYVMAHASMLTHDQFWAMASILEAYKSLFDNLTNKHAQDLVPDDLSELDGE